MLIDIYGLFVYLNLNLFYCYSSLLGSIVLVILHRNYLYDLRRNVTRHFAYCVIYNIISQRFLFVGTRISPVRKHTYVRRNIVFTVCRVFMQLNSYIFPPRYGEQSR